MTSPVVSVWMIAYNHGQYLAQAIESVLAQQTSFPFDIVIGEDCSPDNSREICLAYQTKYPDKIKLLLPEKNIGLHRNVVNTMLACTGKYIALCEGDDYWSDPHKLQKQFDFLEANPDYVMCAHDVYDYVQDTGEFLQPSHQHPDTFGVDYIIAQDWFMRTNTLFFRNGFAEGWASFPEFFFKAYSTDYILQCIIARHGKVHWDAAIMAVYRRHAGGITNVNTELQIKRVKMEMDVLNNINSMCEGRYKTQVRQHISRNSTALLVLYGRLLRRSPTKTMYWWEIIKLLPKLNYGTLLSIVRKSIKKRLA